ncbi:hypothetical protein [Microbacterium lacticum]
MGHSLGASGGRIIGHAAHELARRGGGVAGAAICIGVGQGLAVVLERCARARALRPALVAGGVRASGRREPDGRLARHEARGVGIRAGCRVAARARRDDLPRRC